MVMSAPAAKAFSEPVMTMQPMSSSALKSLSAAPSSSTRASFKALRAWGRFKVMRPTLPRVSTMMFSKVMGAPPVILFRWRRRASAPRWIPGRNPSRRAPPPPWRPGSGQWGGHAAAEAGSWSRLHHPIHLDESAPGPIVGVGRRLVHAQHRGDAGVRALQQGAPLGPAAGRQVGGEAGLQRRPAAALPLVREIRVGDAGLFQEQGVELGFDGPDGDEAAVGAAIGVVEGGAPVQQVAAPRSEEH